MTISWLNRMTIFAEANRPDRGTSDCTKPIQGIRELDSKSGIDRDVHRNVANRSHELT